MIGAFQQEISKSGKGAGKDQSQTILDALSSVEGGRPRWLDTDWMTIHDPEPSEEKPRLHHDVTAKRTVVLYYDERVCGGYGRSWMSVLVTMRKKKVA